MRLLGGVWFAVTMGLLLGLSQAWAAETESPQFIQKCFEKAVKTADIRDCYSQEYDYWDTQLNINYKKALQACDIQAKQVGSLGYVFDAKIFSKNCREELRDAQRAWVKYRDAFGHAKCDLDPDYGGTMSLITCDSIFVDLVKAQAIELGELYEYIMKFHDDEDDED